MRSCSSWMVFMQETAEQVASVDSGWLVVADKARSGGWIRRLQPERPVRPMGVVVLGVDSKDLLEVAASDDQKPVQALSADGTDPAFRVGVRVGGLHRRDEYLSVLRAEHVIEPARELRVPVADEEAHPTSLFS
jgi:hypothetical protein